MKTDIMRLAAENQTNDENSNFRLFYIPEHNNSEKQKEFIHHERDIQAFKEDMEPYLSKSNLSDVLINKLSELYSKEIDKTFTGFFDDIHFILENYDPKAYTFFDLTARKKRVREIRKRFILLIIFLNYKKALTVRLDPKLIIKTAKNQFLNKFKGIKSLSMIDDMLSMLKLINDTKSYLIVQRL